MVIDFSDASFTLCDSIHGTQFSQWNPYNGALLRKIKMARNLKFVLISTIFLSKLVQNYTNPIDMV